MAYGQNTRGAQPRSHFQEAGGAIIKFRHPYLAGQMAGSLDEVDISSSLKLNETYFNAVPNQDSAQQVVLIDGSTVTITNKLLNGTMTLPAVVTTGIVATGDFIACLQLIKSVGDNVGGVLTITEHIDGKAITTLYYGVTPKNVPDKIKMGMDVPTYSCQLLYSGWIQAVSVSGEANKKAIWASGSKTGLEAYFKPYAINAENEDTGSGTASLNASTNGVATADADQTGTSASSTWADNKTPVGANPDYINSSDESTLKVEG